MAFHSNCFKSIFCSILKVIQLILWDTLILLGVDAFHLQHSGWRHSKPSDMDAWQFPQGERATPAEAGARHHLLQLQHQQIRANKCPEKPPWVPGPEDWREPQGMFCITTCYQSPQTGKEGWERRSRMQRLVSSVERQIVTTNPPFVNPELCRIL